MNGAQARRMGVTHLARVKGPFLCNLSIGSAPYLGQPLSNVPGEI